MTRTLSLAIRRRFVAAGLVALLGGCQSLGASFTPLGSTRPTAGGTRGTTGIDGYGPPRTVLGHDTSGVTRPRDRAGRGTAPRGELSTRRQCRVDGVPRGWLAISYEAASADCPARPAFAHDSVATVAVIVRYGNAPIGTVLDVCVDQPFPSGWTRLSAESADDPGACPGATRRGDATAVRIRRDF